MYRSGFTTITGVAFGPDGSLFVTEFARNFADAEAAGSCESRPTAAARCSPAARSCMAPTGAAVDSTGAVYVSNFSVLPRKTPKNSPFRGAGGTLVKITP